MPAAAWIAWRRQTFSRPRWHGSPRFDPRCNVGKGITGAARYALGEGSDPETGERRKRPAGDQSRVEWIGGTGFRLSRSKAARTPTLPGASWNSTR